MRDKTNVEVRYNLSDEEDNRLDESKEEETPLMQIARILEKNGTNSNIKDAIKVITGFIIDLLWRRTRRKSKRIQKASYGRLSSMPK